MGSSCSAEVSGAQGSRSGPWCQLGLGCGVGSATGMLVSPWPGWGLLRNDSGMRLRLDLSIPPAPTFLFQLVLSTGSELCTPRMSPPHSFAHGASWVPCPAVLGVHSHCTQRGAGPQKAELGLCHGPSPTLCFCPSPGLSECDHHRNHQDQQPGRKILLSEYLWDPRPCRGQIPPSSRERAALWGGGGCGTTLL